MISPARRNHNDTPTPAPCESLQKLNAPPPPEITTLSREEQPLPASWNPSDIIIWQNPQPSPSNSLILADAYCDNHECNTIAFKCQGDPEHRQNQPPYSYPFDFYSKPAVYRDIRPLVIPLSPGPPRPIAGPASKKPTRCFTVTEIKIPPKPYDYSADNKKATSLPIRAFYIGGSNTVERTVIYEPIAPSADIALYPTWGNFYHTPNHPVPFARGEVLGICQRYGENVALLCEATDKKLFALYLNHLDVSSHVPEVTDRMVFIGNEEQPSTRYAERM